jgi:hypothetical protein
MLTDIINLYITGISVLRTKYVQRVIGCTTVLSFLEKGIDTFFTAMQWGRPFVTTVPAPSTVVQAKPVRPCM